MRPHTPRRLIQAMLLAALGHTATACAQAAIDDTGQGQVPFASTAIGELSGITYLGGDNFVVVSDTNGTMAPAAIVIDRTTGRITSASLGTPTPVAGGADLEGVAFDPRDGSLLVSDEAGNTITRHDAGTGQLLGSVAVPSIFDNARGNLGLESLSLDPVGYSLWTANEEALSGDGPTSTDSAGTIVRLQQFDGSGQPVAQYGYLTEPHAGSNNIVNRAQSGVSDLIALPNSGLIVIERELGGAIIPTLRNRIYLIDPAAAIDTTSTPSLAGVTDGLVDKQLLFQVDAQFTNFEGIALGPMLSDGDFVLVLVSDDGSGTTNPQNLLTLRLSGLAVEGDLTGDFRVDDADLAVVLNAWGDGVSAGDRLAGDPSGDGAVGIDDLDVVLSHWTGPQPPPTVVPEPAGLASLGGVAWAALLRRW